jgi:hypothetical protein
MTSDHEYRKKAADAQRMAEQTDNREQKVSWLRIATGWLNRIGKPKSAVEQRFDDQVQSDGTGQQRSHTSH